ncbi:hypothetical protein AAON49_07065 [Pseudotenacibaculum sp. MALMAid0570]|uniref:hypothetical protein n=1 Tax=Pseudotenacibaculum sp. MALMAid0570 TaxID=3143938 RepID=UPI0032E05274
MYNNTEANNLVDSLAEKLSRKFNYSFYVAKIINKPEESINQFELEVCFNELDKSFVDKSLTDICDKFQNTHNIKVKVNYYQEPHDLDEQIQKSIKKDFDNEENLETIVAGGGGIAIDPSNNYDRTLGIIFSDQNGSKKYGITCEHGNLKLYQKLRYARRKLKRPNPLIGEIIYQNCELDYSIIDLYELPNPYTYEKFIIDINDAINFEERLNLKKDDPVLKYGNKTSLTKSKIYSDYSSFKIKDDKLRKSFILVDNYKLRFSKEGDSGSVVLTQINNKKYAIGLISFHSNGKLHVSPITKISNHLEKNSKEKIRIINNKK